MEPGDSAACVETRADGIIANAPVDRRAIQEFNCFQFNAWSPLGFKLKAEGGAKNDSVGKNHCSYPPFAGW
jgi:hypothetical protein